MDFKDRMIEAYERGECGYYDAYDYVRESMASGADLARKKAKETPKLRAYDACRCDVANKKYVRSCRIHGVLREAERVERGEQNP